MLFDCIKDYNKIKDPIKEIKNNHFIKKVKTFFCHILFSKCLKNIKILKGQFLKNIIFIQKKFLYENYIFKCR